MYSNYKLSMADAQEVSLYVDSEINEDRRRNRYKKIVIVCMCVSLLLQTIAVISPGWAITSNDNVTRQAGIFYERTCDDQSCETTNILKSYLDDINQEQDIEFKLHTEKELLVTYLRQVIGVLLSWTFTLVSVLVLGYRMKKQKSLTHAWFITAVMTIVSGFIMGELMYVYLVELGIGIRLNRSSDVYIHFCYCPFLFAIACCLQFVSAVFIFKCQYDEIILLRKMAGDRVG